MDKIKISIIIPFYNVEQYIEQCIKSVCEQTYKNLEILCINDCSSDNSVNILRKYEPEDKRIKIINREHNGGISIARNTGLDCASGDYIYFIDSDDWIDSNYVEEMIKAAKKSDADIVLNTRITKEYEGNSEPLVWEKYPKAPVNGEFIKKQKAIQDTHCMLWAHLYKKSFIDKHNLAFPEGYIHEDNYFNAIAKTYTEQIFAFEGPVYHYRIRNTSIMHQREDKALHYLKIFNLIFIYYKEHNLLDKIENKLFEPTMLIPVKNEESYMLAKTLYNNLKSYVKCFTNLYSDYELFIINSLLETKDFSEYIKNYSLDMRVCYIKRNIKKRND